MPSSQTAVYDRQAGMSSLAGFSKMTKYCIRLINPNRILFKHSRGGRDAFLKYSQNLSCWVIPDNAGEKWSVLKGNESVGKVCCRRERLHPERFVLRVSSTKQVIVLHSIFTGWQALDSSYSQLVQLASVG